MAEEKENEKTTAATPILMPDGRVPVPQDEGEFHKDESPVIEIRHLVKDYGQGRGVFDVSFSVYKGECFGFLGPNGAGKSTTIRHLMGFSIPDSGETLLKGMPSSRNRSVLMQGVSYIPGEVALPQNLKGKDVIEEQMKLKGLRDRTFLDWLKKTFEVDDSLYCRQMSLGMKRKIAIVTAFMNDPDVIIMDEPSSGLDPEMQERFIQLILLEKKRGKTILLSSHLFGEVDACCDRIAIIKDGKIVSHFVAADLKHKSTKQYHITYPTEEDCAKAKDRMASLGYTVADSTVSPCRFSCFVNDADVNRFLADLPRGMTDFTEKKETLEDYFMSFYKENKEYGGVSK